MSQRIIAERWEKKDFSKLLTFPVSIIHWNWHNDHDLTYPLRSFQRPSERMKQLAQHKRICNLLFFLVKMKYNTPGWNQNLLLLPDLSIETWNCWWIFNILLFCNTFWRELTVNEVKTPRCGYCLDCLVCIDSMGQRFSLGELSVNRYPLSKVRESTTALIKD